jgi:hypothetical protein
MDGNNRNEPRTQFTQFDRQVLGTMHVSLDSAQVEEEKPLRSSGEMLMVASVISHSPPELMLKLGSTTIAKSARCS